MARLRQEGHDGHAGVAANDGDALVGRIGPLDMGHKARSANGVEGGYPKQTSGVVHAFGLEDLGTNGNG